MIEFDQSPDFFSTTIKVIGVGGAGGNAVNTMIDKGIQGVEFIVANTDVMDLKKSKAKIKVQLGQKITRGHGTGNNPEIGKEAAIESLDELRSVLEDTDMLFIAAGFGGGTGTGAAPIIAELAKEMDILTLGIFTSPFAQEGLKKQQNFETGLTRIREKIDSYIIIPNDKLSGICADMIIFDVFKKADSIIYDAAKAMSDIINRSGYINVDFADVKTVIGKMGYALMGTGICDGEDRAVRAAKEAISNPLLDDISLSGCKSILINITIGNDMKFTEFEEIMSVINSESGPSANIISGLVVDEEMNGKIAVTIFATGLAHLKDKNYPNLIHYKNEDDNNSELNEIFKRIGNSKENDIDTTKSYTQQKETSKSEDIGIPAFMRRFSD
jgi:cell division protein FtsZ